MSDWFQSVFTSDFSAGSQPPEATLFMIALAFVIGQFIGWVYMATHVGVAYSRSFVASLVVLPMTIGLMMVLMAGSIVVAFGLLAVFGVIRFNNVVDDTLDTTFLLWGILEGVGLGTQRYTTSALAACGIALTLAYLRATGFGAKQRFDSELEISLIRGDSVVVLGELSRLLRVYCVRHHLVEQNSAPDGIELSYRLLLRDPLRGSEFRETVKGVEGIRQVSLVLHDRHGEI